jgi:hypothetical protein
LDQGAPFEGLDWHRKTALHWAAEHGCEEVARLLLERGAKTDKQDRYGETPLHYAAEGGHLGLVKLLVARALTGQSMIVQLDGVEHPCAVLGKRNMKLWWTSSEDLTYKSVKDNAVCARGYCNFDDRIVSFYFKLEVVI